MNDRRHEVLQQVRDARTPVGVAEVARALDVHPNTVRFHLRVLIEQGRVERVRAESDGPGRPAEQFRPVVGMDPGGTRNYTALARVLVAGLAAGPDPAGRAAAAGREWGRELAASAAACAGRKGPVRRLVDLLDGLGFAPSRSGEPARARIGLHHCPFLELAVENPRVICSVHRGLMDGALAEWGSDAAVSSLDAFAEPGLCVARLKPAGRSR